MKDLESAVETIATIRETLRSALQWICNFADVGYDKEIGAPRQSQEVKCVARVALLNGATVMIYTYRLEPLELVPRDADA